MSFERVTTYKRSILRPLVVSSSSVGPKTTGVDSQLRLSRSQPWQESTHIFIGTGDRDESDAWPPTKFSDDPTNIPDSDRHNIPYDIASAESRQQDFKLYSDRTQKGSNVLPPRIVVKRYIPTAKADNGEQGITLLMLTGMGAVKEVRLTRPARLVDQRTLLTAVRCLSLCLRTCCLSFAKRVSGCRRFGRSTCHFAGRLPRSTQLDISTVRYTKPSACISTR